MAINIGEVVEVIFDLYYLITVWTIVIFMYKRREKVKDSNVAHLFFFSFLLLATGDTPHLLTRVVAIFGGNLLSDSFFVGLGALGTGITMTFYYSLFLEIWRRYASAERNGIYWALQSMIVIRFIIFPFPQNEWTAPLTPFPFGILRNIPLTILGVGIAILMVRQGDQFMKNLGMAIFASYFFYAPVILFVTFVPAIGSLMIFKTIAYLAMACLALRKYYLDDEELEGWNRIVLKTVFKLSLVDMKDSQTSWPKIGSKTTSV